MGLYYLFCGFSHMHFNTESEVFYAEIIKIPGNKLNPHIVYIELCELNRALNNIICINMMGMF